MRKEIRQLALRALAADPLSAEAYELLGTATDEPERVRALMQKAASHSRHDAAAVLWLLNDSFNSSITRQNSITAICCSERILSFRNM